MKDIFKLIKLDNEPYDFLIIATSVTNPLSCLDDIENKIGKESVKVLFDLTLINGLNSNRYIKGECIKGKFVVSSFMVVSDVNESIKSLCKSFFIGNDEAVQNSVITNQIKYLIRQ